ncbi:MAG: pseudouridine synthase [Bacteroidota bacterium]|jgi:23S rRNA pseudouridine2605 synthase
MQKRTDNFSKFANQKKGSALKEAFRQEKKKNKIEARAAGEEMRQRKKDKMRGLVTEPLKKSTKPGARKSAPTDRDERAPRAVAATGATGARPAGSARPITPAKTSRGKDAQAAPVAGMPVPIALKNAEQMPLNKFIAHSGVCGRREAAELVKGGKVVVNGDKIFEPGFKVAPTDKVLVKGKQVYLQKNAVYILLNKPKDYITTANDPEGRKTVLDIIKGATADRVYPVGRLDRNTTGVLLLTNDGELAQKLTHPSFEIKKIYEVTLDRPVAKKDLEAVLAGVTLEDGFVAADACGYANAKDKNVIGIEIHSGRNRIVRRIFEHLGYDVRGLDRVMFANLTKKNVDRGKYRFLQEKEVRLLKFMNKSFVRKSKEEEA